MKNKLYSILVLIFSFFWVNFDSIGQLITLDVPLYGQQNNTWCWAASIQMVLKSYGKNQTQQSIVDEYNNLNNIHPDGKCYGCSTDNQCLADDRYVQNLPCSSNETECKNTKKIQGFNTANSFGMDWNVECSDYSFDYYKKNIDSGTPIVVFVHDHLKSVVLSERGFSHAIVIIGYFINKSQKYLIVNDPWKLCSGCTYAYDYNTFRCNFSYNLKIKPNPSIVVKNKELDCSNRIREFEQLTKIYIQNILQPSEDKKNISFEKEYQNLDSINVIKKISLTPSTFIDYEQPNYLKSSSLSLIVTSGKFRDVSAEIVQSSVLDRCYELFSNMFYISTPTGSSTSTVTLTTTRYSGIYRIKKINFCNCSLLCCPKTQDLNPCSITKMVKIDNESVVIGTKQIPFKIIDYPFLNCTYRLFMFNDVEYMTPNQETIFSDGEKVYSDIAYESSFIYSKLKNDTYKFYPKFKLNARE